MALDAHLALRGIKDTTPNPRFLAQLSSATTVASRRQVHVCNSKEHKGSRLISWRGLLARRWGGVVPIRLPHGCNCTQTAPPRLRGAKTAPKLHPPGLKNCTFAPAPGVRSPKIAQKPRISAYSGPCSPSVMLGIKCPVGGSCSSGRSGHLVVWCWHHLTMTSLSARYAYHEGKIPFFNQKRLLHRRGHFSAINLHCCIYHNEITSNPRAQRKIFTFRGRKVKIAPKVHPPAPKKCT